MAQRTLDVPIGVDRTLQATAHKTDGSLSTGSSTMVCRYVKQSSPVEYWNGSAWVTGDPGNQAMAEDATITGTYEDTYQLDEAGVDYIVDCWDTADATVIRRRARLRGRQPNAEDRVCSLTVTVKDTDTNGDPIPDVTVSVKNASGREVSRDTTDSNGEAADLGVAGAATYTVVMVKATWTLADQALAVSQGDIDSGTKAVEYYGTGFDPGTPDDPNLCTVYDWLKELIGAVAISGRTIVPKLIEPQTMYDASFEDGLTTTTDAEGYWELDLPRGAKITIYSTADATNLVPDGAVQKTIDVPDQGSAQLQDLDDG